MLESRGRALIAAGSRVLARRGERSGGGEREKWRGLGFGAAEGVLVGLGGRWRGAPGVRWPRHAALAFRRDDGNKDGGGTQRQ